MTALLPVRRLHDKVIVIDGRYVVEGSMNWSISALKENFESVSIIDSPEHARKKLARMATLTLPAPTVRARQTDRPLLPLPEIIEMPRALFEKEGLPRLVQTSDIRALNLFLIPWGQKEAGGKREIEADLETLAQALRMPSEWERARARRQVIKVLRKLAKRYKLLEVEFPFARDAQITLKEFPGETVAIPREALEPESFSQESSSITFLNLARSENPKRGQAPFGVRFSSLNG